MGAGTRKRSVKASLLTLFFISLTLQYAASSAAGSDLTFHAVTNPDCESCVLKLKPLLNLYGDSVTEYDIRDEENLKRFNDVVGLINSKSYDTPLVVAFNNKRLFAVVFGGHSEGEWQNILNTEHAGVPVYSNRYMQGKIIPDTILTDKNVTHSIAILFVDVPQDEGTANDYPNIYALLPLIVAAALVDAVNPCEFYVLVVFLSTVLFRFGRKNVLKSGLAYAAAVFVAYYLMGLSLLRLMSYAQQMKTFIVAILSVLGLALGCREVLEAALDRKFKHVPDLFSKNISAHLERVSENPLTAFIIGLMCGLFLLPCTSGPYFMALGLISNFGRLLDGLILLMLYNGIIVAPFIAITLGVYTMKLRTGQLKKWSSTSRRWVNLASGLVIVFLSLYLLFTLIV